MSDDLTERWRVESRRFEQALTTPAVDLDPPSGGAEYPLTASRDRLLARRKWGLANRWRREP